MQFSKGMLAVVAIVPLLVGLNGCASRIIGVREGAERVSLADANQVANCQSKGGATISIFAKGRSVEEVEANMYQMARNEAVDKGADTVVKGASPELGKRTFSYYKCRP
ncbi:MAG: DUF4156 domain-containing protein [Gammaproteobacteria bacterium]|nr:DUF4156 domain-containing protein [Gammaproteobacteria bacterium]MBU1775679.1 DUF4156 domain-containing protein [Gammaproteobacteria bacterium]MBU1969615.1 DUF4156 domain-containing protein [Gammaproteobacteria bacterium]